MQELMRPVFPVVLEAPLTAHHQLPGVLTQLELLDSARVPLCLPRVVAAHLPLSPPAELYQPRPIPEKCLWVDYLLTLTKVRTFLFM